MYTFNTAVGSAAVPALPPPTAPRVVVLAVYTTELVRQRQLSGAQVVVASWVYCVKRDVKHVRVRAQWRATCPVPEL
jgi:hypothetical protein